MFTLIHIIVLTSLTACFSLLVILIILYVKLNRLYKKNREIEHYHDQVFLYPKSSLRTNRSNETHVIKEIIPNRMVQILQVNKRLSFEGYPPMAGEASGASIPWKRELLQIPASPGGYASTSGSESSLVRSSETSTEESSELRKRKREKSDLDSSNEAILGEEASSSGHDLEIPKLDFNVNYFSSTSSLNVTIVKLSNLPAQFRKNCSSYVKVSLKGFNKLKTRRFKTKTIRNSLNPKFEEELVFLGYEFDELKNFRVRFSCYAKSRKLGKKVLVGDLFVPLSRPDFEANTLLCCSERLSLACPMTGKRGPQLIAGELGYIQLELQYVRDSRRLKVMIRKGQHLLSKSDSANGEKRPVEFYVIVSLLRNGEAITYKESKSAFGSNAAWNEAFLFYLDGSESEDDYWLQLLVMRGNLYAKDGAVGQVLVGSKIGTTGGSVSGRAHWREAFEAGHQETGDAREVVRWHEITHIKTSCL